MADHPRSHASRPDPSNELPRSPQKYGTELPRIPIGSPRPDTTARIRTLDEASKLSTIIEGQHGITEELDIARDLIQQLRKDIVGSLRAARTAPARRDDPSPATDMALAFGALAADPEAAQTQGAVVQALTNKIQQVQSESNDIRALYEAQIALLKKQLLDRNSSSSATSTELVETRLELNEVYEQLEHTKHKLIKREAELAEARHDLLNEKLCRSKDKDHTNGVLAELETKLDETNRRMELRLTKLQSEKKAESRYREEYSARFERGLAREAALQGQLNDMAQRLQAAALEKESLELAKRHVEDKLAETTENLRQLQANVDQQLDRWVAVLQLLRRLHMTHSDLSHLATLLSPYTNLPSPLGGDSSEASARASAYARVRSPSLGSNSR